MFHQTAKVISFHEIVSSNKLLDGAHDYDISVGIPEEHDPVSLRYCTLYADIRKNPISRYTQSMLVILSGTTAEKLYGGRLPTIIENRSNRNFSGRKIFEKF